MDLLKPKPLNIKSNMYTDIWNKYSLIYFLCQSFLNIIGFDVLESVFPTRLFVLGKYLKYGILSKDVTKFPVAPKR